MPPDLPAALRQLADHLERKEISVSLWNLQGNGMSKTGVEHISDDIRFCDHHGRSEAVLKAATRLYRLLEDRLSSFNTVEALGRVQSL